MLRFLISILLLLPGVVTSVVAQDTSRVSFPVFMEKAQANLPFVALSELRVDQAELDVTQVNSMRWLPRLELRSNHGLVPGIITDSSRERAFLDPNLGNDWENWGIFTEIGLRMAQPVFTWGALGNLMDAAREGVKAAERLHESDQLNLENRLLKIYQARVAGEQSLRLLIEAREAFEKAEKQFKEMKESGEDITAADEYKFKIYRYEFENKVAEVENGMKHVRRIWKVLLNEEGADLEYLPIEIELTRLRNELPEFSEFYQNALINRPDVRALNHGVKAAEFGYAARRSATIPALIFGFQADFITSPRPVQSQPLIGNRYTFVNFAYTFGFRINLNPNQLKYELDRTSLQVQRSKKAKNALEEQIRWEISDLYSKLETTHQRVLNTSEAFQLSKEWLREEQLDYDLGLGEVDNLVDAVKSKLEWEAKLLEQTLRYNELLSQFYIKAGKSVLELYD